MARAQVENLKHAVTRRSVLRSAALGALGFAARRGTLFGQTPSTPPNIVFIMADDLGYADVSCYGRPDLSTPNIDRIAARGMRFLQGYANSAVCSATRTALITGRYQYRLRLGLEEPLGTGTATGFATLRCKFRTLSRSHSLHTDSAANFTP